MCLLVMCLLVLKNMLGGLLVKKIYARAGVTDKPKYAEGRGLLVKTICEGQGDCRPKPEAQLSLACF